MVALTSQMSEAHKADQIPHLCELDDKTDAGMDREGREARRQSDGAPRAKKVKTTPDKAPGVPGQWGFIMERERERTTQQLLGAVASIASSNLCEDQKTKIIAQLMELGDKSKSQHGGGPTPSSASKHPQPACSGVRGCGTRDRAGKKSPRRRVRASSTSSIR